MGDGGSLVQDSSVDATSLENVEALLQAARYDDLVDIKTFESTGISLFSKDSQGRTVDYEVCEEEESIEELSIQLQFEKQIVKKASQLRDLNAINGEMNTPLHWACLNGHVEVVKKLILAGANLSVLNSYGGTPIDEAVSREKMDVLDSINAAAA